jgi:hypothetical protein
VQAVGPRSPEPSRARSVRHLRGSRGVCRDRHRRLYPVTSDGLCGSRTPPPPPQPRLSRLYLLAITAWASTSLEPIYQSAPAATLVAQRDRTSAASPTAAYHAGSHPAVQPGVQPGLYIAEHHSYEVYNPILAASPGRPMTSRRTPLTGAPQALAVIELNTHRTTPWTRGTRIAPSRPRSRAGPAPRPANRVRARGPRGALSRHRRRGLADPAHLPNPLHLLHDYPTRGPTSDHHSRD